MQWKTKPIKPVRPNGQLRIITRFLFYPKSLDGTTMWLCLAKIEQKWIAPRFHRSPDFWDFGGYTTGNYWTNIRWVK